MTSTQKEIIELARQAGFGYNGLGAAVVRHSSGVFVDVLDELETFATILLERFGAGGGGGEPVAWQKAIIRGEEWGDTIVGWEPCTKSEAQYLMKPTRALYPHPSPAELRAEYLRGLEDAAKVADANATDEPYGHAKFRCVNIAEAIRALKGKQ